MVLYEADSSKAPDGNKLSAPKKAAKADQGVTKRASKVVVAKHAAPALQEPNERGGNTERRPSNGPDVNINLQIHISADASPDQIEQIFMSISKHLYKNGQ